MSKNNEIWTKIRLIFSWFGFLYLFLMMSLFVYAFTVDSEVVSDQFGMLAVGFMLGFPAIYIIRDILGLCVILSTDNT